LWREKVKKGFNIVMHLLAVSVLVVIVGIFVKSHSLQKPVEEVNAMTENLKSRITIVYDNNAYDPNLTTAWGFACVMEAKGHTILFDTGGDGNILLNNMKKLGLDPKKIDIVFLSHVHSDHVGGLDEFLERNPNVTVYFPHSFPASFRDRITALGGRAVAIDKPQEIAAGMHSTGEMGTTIEEHALVVETPEGFIVITGCAHPGIVEIIERAEEIVKSKPRLVLGGFHLKGASADEVKKVMDMFKKYGVERVGPAHCSGDRTRELFKREYGNNYIPAGVGTVIDISK
jgi:7,8-dihydropterin-6-yl-methyl-4-(beta-D-ribofuranosyl)aminobenzene 5'-phosphate synthase